MIMGITYLDSFRISLESFSFYRGPLLLKPVTGQELFFAVSYSKPDLIIICCVVCQNAERKPNGFNFEMLLHKLFQAIDAMLWKSGGLLQE